MYCSVAPTDQQQTDRPDGVSETNWKKFQELKERRLKISHQNKRKRRQKPNKKTIALEQQSEEEQIPTSNQETLPKPTNKKESEEKWKELRQYFPHSSNLETSNSLSSSEKNKEEAINEAIERQDFKVAESLSDKLATKDFVSKAAHAMKTRDFAEKRKLQDEQKQVRRKKKKLHWGFEQKQRWESKGNM